MHGRDCGAVNFAATERPTNANVARRHRRERERDEREKKEGERVYTTETRIWSTMYAVCSARGEGAQTERVK